MGDERALRGRVVDEARREEALGNAADRVGDPPERLAGRAAEPVAAAQRDHGRAGLARRLVERVGERGDRRPVADADDPAVANRGPKHVCAKAADQPPADVLGSPEARREMDRLEVEALTQLVAGGTGLGGLVDDPDLDDALGACPLQDPRDLRPGDAEQLRDA